MPHLRILRHIRKIIVACDRSDTHQTRSSKDCPSRCAETQASTIPAPPPYEPVQGSQKLDIEWNIRGHTRHLEYDLQNTFSQERVQLSNPPIIHDAVLFTPNDEKFYRRLLLDPTVETDIMSEDIARLLSTPVDKGYGAEIRLPDGRTVKSLGVIETRWQIYRCQRVHNTTFHVVRDRRYDLVLGRTSISQLRLSGEE